ITKVHTGAGDSGKTRLLDGTEVGKEHPRVRLYGTIDEVNSQVGVVRMELNRMPGISIDSRNSADEAMGRVQQELFDVGGECSCTPGKLPEQMVLIGSDAGDRLVTEMDSWLENLDPLESFIMPTGSPPVATLHVARTVARRAERHACSMRDIDGDGAVRDEVISYLNRLSDWMFVLGRWITRMTGEEEELWTPLGKRED
ncbi:MAG TPA: cob(I)yrinic acid a,c-diamide adenosyltransferase, partial [Candidatus Thalassarchaeum sp.]|nr:cob(I)yrinic acid a,c-diamide adenosyltransferase [Candidatus Thalassarchaeum sp.]